MKRVRRERQAFAEGMRAGIRSVFAIGQHRDDPPRNLQRHFGRLARYQDIEAFIADMSDKHQLFEPTEPDAALHDAARTSDVGAQSFVGCEKAS